mgnify:CR=1 FL=1
MHLKQRGNILFLILLAVVLFAALSYAVTSQRDGGKNASPEAAKSQASALLQYGALVENTVHRMVMVGGVKPEHLDFKSAGISDSGLNGNTNCLTSACKVFDPAGGGIKAQGTPLSAMGTTDVPFTAAGNELRYNVLLGEIKNLGTSQPEILLLIRGLKPEICDAINVAEGVYTSTNSAIPTDTVGNTGTDYVGYEGNLDPWPVLSGIAIGTDSRLFGRRAFCIRQSVSNGYYLVYAVYSR